MTEPLTTADLDAYRQTIRRWGDLNAPEATRLVDELERTREALRQLVADSDAANDGRLPYVSTVTLNRARAVLPPEEPRT